MCPNVAHLHMNISTQQQTVPTTQGDWAWRLLRPSPAKRGTGRLYCLFTFEL